MFLFTSLYCSVLLQNKEVYLLDDPLAAVDAHVALHLYQKCIMGLLSGKTRILCTHHTKFLTNADHVILMDKGKIVKSGKCLSSSNQCNFLKRSGAHSFSSAVFRENWRYCYSVGFVVVQKL